MRTAARAAPPSEAEALSCKALRINQASETEPSRCDLGQTGANQDEDSLEAMLGTIGSPQFVPVVAAEKLSTAVTTTPQTTRHGVEPEVHRPTIPTSEATPRGGSGTPLESNDPCDGEADQEDHALVEDPIAWPHRHWGPRESGHHSIAVTQRHQPKKSTDWGGAPTPETNKSHPNYSLQAAA